MKWMKRLGIFLGFLALGYFLGPRPSFEAFDNTPTSTKYQLTGLDQLLETRETAETRMKPGNEARIVWVDSIRKTEYAIVYLHGFSGSQMEGDPVHRNIASRYGCNLYLTRLPGHGISGDSIFKNIEPAQWVAEAKEAVAIGKTIGQKVILMATSTGCTFAAYLAAGDPDIHSLIFFAPNIEIYDKNVKLLNGPWGKMLANQSFPNHTRSWDASEEVEAHWTNSYDVQGLHALQELVDETMVEDVFQAIKQPIFVSYYYEDDDHMDTVISVAAIRNFITKLGTAPTQIRDVPNTTAKAHAIPSSIWNPNWEIVENDVRGFMEKVLNCEIVKL